MSYTTGEILLNKYRIEKLIGRGAFAEVYRVTHQQLNAPRAIKVLRKDAPGLGSSEYNQYEERFQLEARLGAMFDVPNLVRVYDFEQDGDTLLLVMEYCPKCSLADLLRKTRREGEELSVDRGILIALDIARGLAKLHGRDIVHRDLKPNNILFDAEWRAKVADLGLAQTPADQTRRLVIGSLAPPHPGTPGYMSPEQEKETGYLRPPADVYALGVVLFEMLTGRNYQNLKPGTRLSSLRVDAPAWLDGLLTRMLAEDLNQRPWDGGEVLDLLEKKGETQPASPGVAPGAESIKPDTPVAKPSAPDPQPAPQPGPREPAKAPKLVWVSLAVIGVLLVLILIQVFKPDPKPASPVNPVSVSVAEPKGQAFVLPTSTNPPPMLPTEMPSATNTKSEEPEMKALPTLTGSPTQTRPALAFDDRIVFNSDRSGKDEIWMMNADGSDLRQLTYLNTETRTPSWSPDKKTIAFQSYKDGDFDIYTMLVANPGSLKKLTDNGCPDFAPSWSPDGKWIAFYSLCDGNREIIKMRADGSQRTQLTHSDGNISNLFPTWSPDGTSIAYSHFNGREYENKIMDENGQNSFTFTKGCSPSFSPDGKKIVFSSHCFDPGDLFIYDLETGSVQELYINPWSKATSDLDGIAPMWSPDCMWIVFYNKSENTGYADIWKIKADGSQISLLTDDSPHDGGPDW